MAKQLGMKSLMKTLSMKTIQKKISFLTKPKNFYKILVLIGVLSILFFFRQKFLMKEGFESNAEDFAENISGKKALVLFYADWCGHCKKFMPEWDEISKEVKDKTDSVVLMKVECGDASNNEKHEELMKKYSIKGYPTILSFDENGQHTEYKEDRSKNAIMKFLGL